MVLLDYTNRDCWGNNIIKMSGREERAKKRTEKGRPEITQRINIQLQPKKYQTKNYYYWRTNKMKLPKYKDILKMSKEKIDAALAPIRAKQAQKQAELEVAKLEEKSLTLEAEVVELCVKNPIPFDKIINKQDEIALANRRKKQLANVVEELFGDDED
jgi:hypothetical protein